MRHVLPLLLVACAASSALAQAGITSLELRVADALAAEVRSRMGVSAVVSVDGVEIAVRSRVEGSVGVTIAPDARLDAPVEFGIVGRGPSGRAVSIGRGRANVQVSVRHAVAARTATRGTVLTAVDVAEVVGPPGSVLVRRLPTVSGLVGATLRRDAAGGEVVTALSVILPPAVRVGDVVQARASIGPVQVMGALTVLDNGAEGAIVRVVNRESKREVRARVIRSGVVEVIHE